MEFGRIRKQPKMESQWERLKSGDKSVAKATEVSLQINQHEATIKRSNIRDVAGEFSALAFDEGYTNDEDEYAETMTDVILDAYKDVAQKQVKRKRKRQ